MRKFKSAGCFELNEYRIGHNKVSFEIPDSFTSKPNRYGNLPVSF